MPLITARSDTPEETTDSALIRAVREPLALGWQNIFNSPEFLRDCEEKEQKSFAGR